MHCLLHWSVNRCHVRVAFVSPVLAVDGRVGVVFIAVIGWFKTFIHVCVLVGLWHLCRGCSWSMLCPLYT